MLIDGLQITNTGTTTNLKTETGNTLPATNLVNGRMFVLLQVDGANQPGFYTYENSAWVSTGDITAVTAGSGLTGGGTSGAVSLAVDTGIIATKTYVDGKYTAGTGLTLTGGQFAVDTTAISTKTYADGKVSLAGSTMTGNLVMASGTKITINDAPVTSTDAANKAYVDGIASGVAWKPSVRVASTVGLTLSGTQTVDGVSLQIGDAVLVKNQNSPAQNGIYVVASGAWTYRSDTNTSAAMIAAAVFVREGTVNADTGWVCTSDNIVLGSTNLYFAQFTGSTAYTAGSGINLTGNAISVVMGAGIAQLPTNEVGIDLYTGGGLLLTADGSTSSTATGAQLALTNVGTAGTYGSSTQYPIITTDAKGRVTSVSLQTVATTIPYDVGSAVIGKPAASEVILRFVAVRSFTIPNGYTASAAKANTAATNGSATFTINKNGSSIGSFNFVAGGSTASFSGAGGAIAAGDVITVVAPSTQDATLADIAFTIAATA